jgi:uncharacterized repeat protein (TIGR01451 family)/LPXTG-motif cell wall-anchored protein
MKPQAHSWSPSLWWSEGETDPEHHFGRLAHMSQLRRYSGRLSAIIAIVAASIAVPFLGGVASAHHSEITGSTDCTGTVSFTATAWDTSPYEWASDPSFRTNTDVRVWYTAGGGQVEVARGAFNAGNGFSFSGTFAWPAGATSITLFVQEQVLWESGGEIGDPRSTKVRAPSSCGSNPSTSSSWQCANGNGEITVTFSNNAGPFGAPVTFVVSSPVSDSVTVNSGQSVTRTYGGFVDGTHTVVITANGKDLSVTQTVDCDFPQPGATYTYQCVNGNGDVTFTLTNTGAEAATITIAFNGSTDVIEVAAGGSVNKTYSGLADGNYPALVTSNGTVLDEVVVVDCDQPNPSATLDKRCVNGNGTLELSLANTGTEGTDFTIVVAGMTEVVFVPAGGSTTKIYSGLPDGSTTLKVTAFGKTLIDTSVIVQCDQPGAPDVTVTTGCANLDGTATLLLKNIGGELPLTFVVDGVEYVVPPTDGSSGVEVVLTGYTDGTHVISITVNGVEGDFDQMITTQCDLPSEVRFAPECVDGDGFVVVSLVNNNDDRSVVFTINGITYPAVDPSTTAAYRIGAYGDGPQAITYQIDGEPVPAARFEFTVDCDRSGEDSISLSVECVDGDGNVTISLGNTGGDLPIEFVVNGVTYIVPVNTVTNVTFTGISDGPFNSTITVDGEPQEVSILVECNQPTGTAVCNEVNSDGAVVTYGYTVTNPDNEEITVTWAGGTATLAPGASRTIVSTDNPLVLSIGERTVLTVPAGTTVCTVGVEFTKEIEGNAPAGETFTIRVSRLEGASYVEELTFDITAGETKTFDLPSSLEPAGVSYLVAETVVGTSAFQTVEPSSFTLNGHRGETVSVTITNAYAAIQLDKTVSATETEPAKDLTYTLVATNTGALTLRDVVISDRLPTHLSFKSVSVAGDAALCTLSQSPQPQLVTCVMDDTLATGAKTALITLVATVDTNTPVKSTLVNQAKAVGFYEEGGVLPPEGTGDLSCLPAPSGGVCDLSAEVSTLVKAPGVEPATTPPPTNPPPTTRPRSGVLPATGNSGATGMLVVAGLSVIAGLALVSMRRRPSVGR